MSSYEPPYTRHIAYGLEPERAVIVPPARNPMHTALLVIIAVSTLVTAVGTVFWTYEVLQALQKLAEVMP